MDKMRALPGFVDVNTDMQIASPQLMVDIDRDRAQSLGVTPDQIQNALFTLTAAAGLDDLRAGQPVLGDPGSGPAIPAQAGCAFEALFALGAAENWCR